MHTRFRLLLSALVLTVVWSGPVSAQETDDPGPDSPTTAPEDDFILEEGEERVHSWALTPAGTAEGGGSNRPTLSYTGDPGTVIEDAVTIFNLGNEILTFRLYATDAVNGPEGRFSLLPAGDPVVDVGSWVEIAQELVTVAPGRSATVPITITIPDGAAPGDHSGGVLASNEAFTTNADGAAVIVERRTGTRLLLRVNGPLRSELSVQDLSVDYDTSINPFGGSAQVDFVIENRGNVRLDATADVTVAGPLGIGRSSAPPLEFPDLLPGQSVTVSTVVDGVPALMVATAEVRLDAVDAGDAVTFTPVTRTASAFAPPITLLLLALLAFFGWMARRSYRRHDGAVLDGVIDVGRGVEIPVGAAADDGELVR